MEGLPEEDWSRCVHPALDELCCSSIPKIGMILLITALTLRALFRSSECVNSPEETLGVVAEHVKA